LLKGDSLTRGDLGLPANWDTIHQWMDESCHIGASGLGSSEILNIKNPEIKILNSYNSKPDNEFWESFPNNYPKKTRCTVKTSKLKSYIQKCWFNWTRSQRGVAKKALKRAQGKMEVPLNKTLSRISESTP